MSDDNKGLIDLRLVVEVLRQHGRFDDEEGEVTNNLQDLIDSLATKEGASEPVAEVDENPRFTTAYPLLNDLLQETWWMAKGPNNMDTGMAWYESLKSFLESLATPPAVMPAAPSDSVLRGIYYSAHDALGLAEWTKRARAALSQTMQPQAAAGEQAGAVALYQVKLRLGGGWSDTTKEIYEGSEDWSRRILHLAAPSAAIAAREQEGRRTPQDYAIEHAEYMATTAEGLIEAVNDLAKAEQERDDGSANPSDVDAAQETVSEYLGTLRNRIYEFRKRRDRALASPKEAPSIPQGETLTGLHLAVIGRRHFGNPIPAEWYSAARELETALTQPTTVQQAGVGSQRQQIADLVLGEDLVVSSSLESTQGFGGDIEHRFQISNGTERYGVVIIVTALKGMQPGERKEQS